MEFAWDERKNRANQRKHGLSFEIAMFVFDDPFYVSQQEREVEGEPRWQTIGMISGMQVLVVAHLVDEEQDIVRIVSARNATGNGDLCAKHLKS